jgi:hypothetical protein
MKIEQRINACAAMAFTIELACTEVPDEIETALAALETALRDEVLRRIADNPETEHEHRERNVLQPQDETAGNGGIYLG